MSAAKHDNYEDFSEAEYEESVIIRDALHNLWVAFQTEDGDWYAVRAAHEDDRLDADAADPNRPIGPEDVATLCFPIRCVSEGEALAHE